MRLATVKPAQEPATERPEQSPASVAEQSVGQSCQPAPEGKEPSVAAATQRRYSTPEKIEEGLRLCGTRLIS